MNLVIWDFWLKSKILVIDISVIKLKVVQNWSQVQPYAKEQWDYVHHKWRKAIQHIQLRNGHPKASEAKEYSFCQ